MAELRAQVRRATASRGCTCGCGTLDLHVPDIAPVSSAAGPVPVEATVVGPGGDAVGGLLLFVDGRRLSGWEVCSLVDDPLPMPRAADVRWPQPGSTRSSCRRTAGSGVRPPRAVPTPRRRPPRRNRRGSAHAAPESTVTFSLAEPSMSLPGVTVLTCVHEGLPDTEAAAHLEIGWVVILSGLTTLLETGAPMSGAVSPAEPATAAAR